MAGQQQQSSLSSVQRPNPVKLSSNMSRRGSFPSMLNQVVSSPLTSPTLTSENVPHPHSRGFQQITLSDLARKVPSSHSSASYPRLSTSGMMGRSASVDQVSPALEGSGQRQAMIPGMGYIPGQARGESFIAGRCKLPKNYKYRKRSVIYAMCNTRKCSVSSHECCYIHFFFLILMEF